ncbi:MAG: MFS transporter [Deltaproteobacteria bacterium]|nr:MFS transporter [Deltaproteobacteria bacterium]
MSALRHRNFRLYWSGVIVSVIGWQVQVIGIGWLVYRLTGSPLRPADLPTPYICYIWSPVRVFFKRRFPTNYAAGSWVSMA